MKTHVESFAVRRFSLHKEAYVDIVSFGTFKRFVISVSSVPQADSHVISFVRLKMLCSMRCLLILSLSVIFAHAAIYNPNLAIKLKGSTPDDFFGYSVALQQGAPPR